MPGSLFESLFEEAPNLTPRRRNVEKRRGNQANAHLWPAMQFRCVVASPRQTSTLFKQSLRTYAPGYTISLEALVCWEDKTLAAA